MIKTLNSPISSSTDFSIQSNKNRLMILQGAFYVKGINPGPFGPTYNPEFSNAVSTLQSNAGIGATGVADLLVVKALLSMDAFTVLPQYGGIAEIAEIQRTLNAQYAYDMGSLIPCDGVYGRDLNKALIYALQIQEGFTAAAENLALYNLYLNKFGTTPEAALSEEDIAKKYEENYIKTKNKNRSKISLFCIGL